MFQAKLLLFLVKGVCQIKTKKKEKKLKEQKQQERKQKKKKKRKKKSQLIKDRRKEKENRKQKQVPWTRQCLNNVQNCRKGKRRAIVAWLRHGGCKVIAFFSCKPNCYVFSPVPHQTQEKGKKEGERPERPKPKFPTKSDLINSS